MYRVKFASRRVKKQFDELPFPMFQRIDKVITSLSDDPFPRDVKKLKDMRNCYRVRVGDYRITYEINHEGGEVVITRVMHRKNVYER